EGPPPVAMISTLGPAICRASSASPSASRELWETSTIPTIGPLRSSPSVIVGSLHHRRLFDNAESKESQWSPEPGANPTPARDDPVRRPRRAHPPRARQRPETT